MAEQRTWTTDQEVRLFSLVCDYKPFGDSKEDNLAHITEHINEGIPEKDQFTSDQIWAKLGQHFNLDRVEQIEAGEEDSSTDGETETEKARPTDRDDRRGSTRGRGRAKEAKDESDDGTKDGDSAPEQYSSELSDVDGEDAELAKIQGDDLLPSKRKGVGRGRKKSTVKKEESESKPAADKPESAEGPKTRKRTRSVAKLGPETTPKKQAKTQAGATPTAKRKPKAETTPEVESSSTPEPEPAKSEDAPKEEDDKADKDDTKTRRSKRQAVRRSTRKK